MTGFWGGGRAGNGAGPRKGFRKELCGIPSDPEMRPGREAEASQEGKQLDLKHLSNTVTEPKQEGIPGSIKHFRKVNETITKQKKFLNHICLFNEFRLI